LSTSAASTTQFAELPRLAKLNLYVLAALTAGLTALLWPHWRDNPDLSHGFFMPVIFVYLLHEARQGPQRYFAPDRRTGSWESALLVLGVFALTASGLYAAALDWSHSLVACTLTIALVFVMTAGAVAFSSNRARFIPLNWTTLVAIGLWLLSAPIPPGTYSRLTIGLQLMVTQNVLRALHVLGIAASRQGNVIELASGLVGVEEACSGIRSLVSCIFAGFLFSATLVRRPVARVLLVVVAVPIAIAMNFIRSLTLTLLANAGVNIAGTWHDLTGFAVLAVTATILGGFALLLGRHERISRPAGSLSDTTAQPQIRRWRLQSILSAGLVIVVGLSGFFFMNTRPSVRAGIAVPNLVAMLPAAASGWRVETSHELYQFADTLKTQHLAQRTYLRPAADGTDQITVYLAYWRPGQAPVSLVASHTPDACWPGSGWSPVKIPESREVLSVAGRMLAPAESREFVSGNFPQYVWFWHLYDGRPIAYRDPYSARELLKIAWRYGFTHDGDQLFVRVSSNRPWSAVMNEKFITDVFGNLQPLGL
jgi:exosortase